ncbi:MULTISPECIES: 50S ribosomal protein L24 [Collinsella]|uniref:50S ribosomal protein L24 n=1 Tax=Collinsella TaxID=102106 RepID=UPI000B3651DC|nr:MULTISPECIES: 50S ribosomal protein L24 [Collinsella]OUN48257.1 50S ribosomal protein L24 [Collinsella sp. An7]
MAKMSIKKGDTVKILSGKDRGKQGTVLRAYPAEGKIKVEGVAIVKKAVRPNQQNQTGGIVPQEAKIDASNAMLVCPKCGQATRVGHKQGELDGHKTAIRVCKKCGAEF